MTHFFYSLITFFIAIFFVILGILGVVIPYSPTLRQEALSHLMDRSTTLFLFGFSCIAIGGALLTNIIAQSRRKYYRYTVGISNITVDESIIEQYLADYWKQAFPGQEIPYRLKLTDNAIHVMVDFPAEKEQMTKDAIDDIKSDLRHLFDTTIGYTTPFYLSISFRPE